MDVSLVQLQAQAQAVSRWLAEDNIGIKGTRMNIVDEFIAAINAADVDKICGLLADDHVFIDSQGNRVSGADELRAAWTGYFELFPDYHIEIEGLIDKGNIVSLWGFAAGTYRNLKGPEGPNHWRVPAAWIAVVHGATIRRWHIYADNQPVIEIIRRNA